mgnify:CR=1 FL=1
MLQGIKYDAGIESTYDSLNNFWTAIPDASPLETNDVFSYNIKKIKDDSCELVFMINQAKLGKTYSFGCSPDHLYQFWI